MDWKYTVELKVDLPTTATTLGGAIPLPVNTSQVTPGVVKGSLTWECQTDPTTGADNCYCEAKDVQQQGPRVRSNVNTDVYDLGAFVTSYLQSVPLPSGGSLPDVLPTPKVTASPSVEIDPDIEIRPDGRCFNARVRVKATYSPGKFEIPEISIPVVNASIGPFEFSIGERSGSTFRAQYRICCCSWVTQDDPSIVKPQGQDALEEYKLTEEGMRFVPEFPVVPATGANEMCDCSDYSVSFIDANSDGSTMMKWKIQALEKNCNRLQGTVVDKDGNGTGPFKCTQMANVQEDAEHQAVREE